MRTLPVQFETEMMKQGNKPRFGIEIPYLGKNLTPNKSFDAYLVSETGSGALIYGNELIYTSINFEAIGVIPGDFINIIDCLSPDYEGIYEISNVSGDSLELAHLSSPVAWDVFEYKIYRHYDGLIEQNISMSFYSNQEQGLQSISQIDFSVLNQNLFSDIFSTYSKPEGEIVNVYQWYDDGTEIQWDEKVVLFIGSIIDFPEITEIGCSFSVNPYNNILDNFLLHNISDDDFDDIYLAAGWTFKREDVHLIPKPIIYGSHPFYYGINTGETYNHSTIIHSMPKGIYLGNVIRFATYNERWVYLFSGHALKNYPGSDSYFNVWILQNGRFLKADIYSTNNNADGFSIELAIQGYVNDYIYPNKDIYTTATVGSGSEVNNPGRAVDGNGNTYCEMNVVDETSPTYAKLELNFDQEIDYDMPTTNEKKIYLILEYTETAAGLFELTVSHTSGTDIILPTAKQVILAFDMSDVTTINEGIEIRLDSLAGVDSGNSATVKIYYVVKELNFKWADKFGIDTPPETVLISCQGYKDDSSGTITGTPYGLIQNPIDVAEHLLVEVMGVTDSEIDKDSFDDAKGTGLITSSWKFDFVISENVKLSDVLSDFGLNSASLFLYDSNVFRVIAKRTNTAPFSHSGTNTPDDEDIFDYNAVVSSGSWVQNPIVSGSFFLGKSDIDLITQLIGNYCLNKVDNQYQKAVTLSDTSVYAGIIEKEVLSDYITDETTMDLLLEYMINFYAYKKYYCEFKTFAHGSRLELWDIINVQHPVIEGLLASFTTKKWLVTKIEMDFSTMEFTVGCLLLN